MKNLILIAVFAGLISHIYAQKSFYERVQEPDSIFSVYLEKDTLNAHSLFLVFENRSSDSIILVSDFKNFSAFEYTPGFLINFYFNQELGLPTWGELRPDYYRFSEGRSPAPPRSIIRFPIELPNIGKIRNDIEKGIIFEVFYRYFNITQRKAASFYVKTDYFKLDYLKIYED
jgi:hypothetical protein